MHYENRYFFSPRQYLRLKIKTLPNQVVSRGVRFVIDIDYRISYEKKDF